jgi:hypothetical protein
MRTSSEMYLTRLIMTPVFYERSWFYDLFFSNVKKQYIPFRWKIIRNDFGSPLDSKPEGK